MKNPPRGLHGLALALYTIVVLLVIAQSSAGEGSWIEVTSHEDGGWVTSPEILVEGTATSPLWRMVLEGDDLAAGTFKDVKWANGNITFRPILCFEETFDGNALDEDVWKIVRDVGTIDVSGGKLTLVGTVVMPRDFPLVMSNTTLFPHNASWNAQFDLQFIDYPYMDTGGGLDVMRSTLKRTTWPSCMIS